MFHKDKPVDWLLDHILWVKVCNPDKDQVAHRYCNGVCVHMLSGHASSPFSSWLYCFFRLTVIEKKLNCEFGSNLPYFNILAGNRHYQERNRT